MYSSSFLKPQGYMSLWMNFIQLLGKEAVYSDGGDNFVEYRFFVV